MSFFGTVNPDGAETVGWLDDMGGSERLIVWSLRRWLDGPCAQAEVWNAFATSLGPDRGRMALRAFEGYLAAVTVQTHRRLCRHASSCPCVGQDEADLAAIVGLTGRGETAEAARRAARLVPTGRLADVTRAAGELATLLAGCKTPRREGSAPRDAGFPWLH